MLIIKRAIFLIFCFFVFASSCLAQVVINEFYTPTSDDWVELYNTSDNPINVSGWSLKDNTSTIGTINEATISGKNFFIIEVSNRLNKDKDEVHLLDNSSQEKDSWSYTVEVNNDTSFGRHLDGESWHRLSPVTKNSSNNNSIIVDPSSTSSPAPTSTPKPTSSPTPTTLSSPTPTSSPKPSSTSKNKIEEESSFAKASEDKEATFTGEVLGVTESGEEEKEEPEQEKEKKNNNKFFILPLTIIGSGLLFLLVGSFPFIKHFLKNIRDRKIKFYG